MSKKVKRKVVLIMLCIILLSMFSACGKSWTCDECGKKFTGKAYYGFYGDETYCPDCARSYWSPLPYKGYEK